jgi:hypothetical protein
VENQIEQVVVEQGAQQVGVSVVPETFKVKVHDLHSEDRFDYEAATMDEAINLYKRIVAEARNVEPRPFVFLDDAHWLAQVKYSGGLVRQVWIADSTGRVRGHNAGMRRREQLKANPVALPPTIVAAPKAIVPPVETAPTVAPTVASGEVVPF